MESPKKRKLELRLYEGVRDPSRAKTVRMGQSSGCFYPQLCQPATQAKSLWREQWKASGESEHQHRQLHGLCGWCLLCSAQDSSFPKKEKIEVVVTARKEFFFCLSVKEGSSVGTSTEINTHKCKAESDAEPLFLFSR